MTELGRGIGGGDEGWASGEGEVDRDGKLGERL
jgi:hypothetical protein